MEVAVHVRLSRQRLPLEPVLFAAMGAVVSLAGWRLAVAVEEADISRQEEAAFSLEANARITALQQNVATELEAVRSLVSLYQASQIVDAAEFTLFVNGSLERHPGLRAMEWAAVVPQEARDGVEATVLEGGIADFSVHPPAGTAAPLQGDGPHVVVLFAEPLASNRSDLGLDLASEPKRRATLDAARDSADLRISPPLQLVPTSEGGLDFLAVAPVFAPGAIPVSQVDRETSLSGYAVGVFDTTRLVRASLARSADAGTPSSPLQVLHLRDVTPGSSPVHILSIKTDGTLVDVGSWASSPGRRLLYELDVGGRIWSVEIQAAGTPSGEPLRLSWFVLLGGLLVTLLVTAMVRQRVTHAQHVEERVTRRTAQLRATTDELAEREGLLRAVFEYTEDAILVTGLDGTIRTANPAAAQMFGAPYQGLEGTPIEGLFTDPTLLCLPHRGEGWSDPGVHGLELEARRRDGTCFPAELTVTDFPTPEGPALLGVVRDITVRQEVDQMKRSFLATVNHELRTPLAAVLSSLELLSTGVCGEMSGQAARMVTLASSNGERLLRLINDILDLERLEEPSTALQAELIEPGVLVAEAVRAHQALSAHHGVGLVAAPLPDEVPRVFGDMGRLEQVLGNLLSNALKFTPPGGQVSLDVEVLDDTVRFGVHDDGPGIPASFHDRVFERFTQVDEGASRAHGGSGLGLSIVKSIVQRHGGEVWLVSPQGGGSSFFVALPVAEPLEAYT